jgi:hypothetical protein
VRIKKKNKSTYASALAGRPATGPCTGLSLQNISHLQNNVAIISPFAKLFVKQARFLLIKMFVSNFVLEKKLSAAVRGSRVAVAPIPTSVVPFSSAPMDVSSNHSLHFLWLCIFIFFKHFNFAIDSADAGQLI